MNPVFLNYLKDGKDMFLIDKNESIHVITFVKFANYPYGYGFLKMGDNILYSLNNSNISNIFVSRKEAEDSVYNLFTVSNF